jgi:hypothetical protein
MTSCIHLVKLTYLTLLLATVSCTMRMPREITINELLLSQITDSLNSDSTFFYRIEIDSTDQAALGGVVNGSRVAVISNPSDSSLLLLRSINGQWKQVDSIGFTDFAAALTTRDLNGDGKDELILNGVPNMHGNPLPYVFFADKAGELHYRPDLNLYNIRFNKQTGFVESFYEGGARSLHSKATYKWVGDSLQLLKRAELDFTDERQLTTRIFEVRNGAEIKILEVNGENDIFEKALFHPVYTNTSEYHP